MLSSIRVSIIVPIMMLAIKEVMHISIVNRVVMVELLMNVCATCATIILFFFFRL